MGKTGWGLKVTKICKGKKVASFTVLGNVKWLPSYYLTLPHYQVKPLSIHLLDEGISIAFSRQPVLSIPFPCNRFSEGINFVPQSFRGIYLWVDYHLLLSPVYKLKDLVQWGDRNQDGCVWSRAFPWFLRFDCLLLISSVEKEKHRSRSTQTSSSFLFTSRVKHCQSFLSFPLLTRNFATELAAIVLSAMLLFFLPMRPSIVDHTFLLKFVRSIFVSVEIKETRRRWSMR